MRTKITRACLELIFLNSSKGAILVSAVVWVLILFQKPFFPLPLLVLWAGLMTVLFSVRGWFGSWVLARDPRLDRYDEWYWKTFALVMFQAIGWSFSGFFFYPPGASLEQAFHIITITGVGPIAVSVNAPDIRMVHTYLIVTQVPLFLKTLWMGDLIHLLMACLILFNFLIVWMNGIRMNQVIVNSFQLRFTNEDLIEELRRAKLEAENANRAKSDFLARMSHEIRTPMNAVLGFNAILQADDPLPHQRERLEIVHSSATSLLRLLDNILDLSKVESGHMQVEKAPFDPEPVIFEPAELASALLGERPVEILCDTDELPRELVGDGFRLRQVLMNLLGNAVKFTQRGFVRLSARIRELTPQQCCISFAVTDTGIGVAPEKLQHIFEPFAQADESVSRQYGGTGLGLAISRRLIRSMGGDLAVQSEIGKGTCFSFDLLFGCSSAVPEIPSPTYPRVLLLDEVPQSSDIVARLFSRWGSSIVQAPQSDEALQLHASVPFDLICVDLTRPRIDPVGFAAALRSDRTKFKPVQLLGFLALTRSTAQVASQVGFDLFCRKPLRPRLLRHALWRDENAPTDESIPGKSQSSPVPGRRILVAEDNAVNQKLIQLLLQRFGHETEIVETGKVALERIREGRFHLVIMDVSMPDMDGIEATWRARKEGSTVPIIICSASAMKQDIENARSAGANGFLTKPYLPEQLSEAVNQHALRDP